MAGFRGPNSGLLDSVGIRGHYWSSTVLGTSSRYMFLAGGNAAMDVNVRAYGLAVRCLKD
jgi:hypothetical protein